MYNFTGASCIVKQLKLKFHLNNLKNKMFCMKIYFKLLKEKCYMNIQMSYLTFIERKKNISINMIGHNIIGQKS